MCVCFLFVCRQRAPSPLRLVSPILSVDDKTKVAVTPSFNLPDTRFDNNREKELFNSITNNISATSKTNQNSMMLQNKHEQKDTEASMPLPVSLSPHIDNQILRGFMVSAQASKSGSPRNSRFGALGGFGGPNALTITSTDDGDEKEDQMILESGSGQRQRSSSGNLSDLKARTPIRETSRALPKQKYFSCTDVPSNSDMFQAVKVIAGVALQLGEAASCLQQILESSSSPQKNKGESSEKWVSNDKDAGEKSNLDLTLSPSGGGNLMLHLGYALPRLVQQNNRKSLSIVLPLSPKVEGVERHSEDSTIFSPRTIAIRDEGVAIQGLARMLDSFKKPNRLKKKFGKTSTLPAWKEASDQKYSLTNTKNVLRKTGSATDLFRDKSLTPTGQKKPPLKRSSTFANITPGGSAKSKNNNSLFT